MDSWSKRRKSLIATSIIILILILLGLFWYIFLYKTPTCFDGKQNGRELGVDCGGKCERLCQNNFLSPIVAWTRYEEVAPTLYNVAAYIVNPNADGTALNVPYRMSLYDSEGMLIVETDGVVSLPPHRNTLAFKSAVSVGQSKPVKVFFEFLSVPDWHKSSDPLSLVKIIDKNYTEDEVGSSLSVTLQNDNYLPINNISVHVVLYDRDGNALGFSKTYIDGISANGKTIAPFTWGINRQGKVISIEVLPVAE